MHRLAGRPIFSVGDGVFTWEDVVLAAYVSGAFAELERRVASQAAANGVDVAEEDVEGAAERWRYGHDLLAADDLDSWLRARSLDEDEWLAWVARSVAASRARGRPKRVRAGELEPLLFVDAMCSGWAAGVIEHLAGRAAAADRAASEGGARAPGKSKLDGAVGRLPAAIRRHGLFELAGGECVRRVREIASMDAVAGRFLARSITPELIAREVGAHTLEWTRLGTEELTFDSEGAAREAVLLVRQDGLSMTEAAVAAKLDLSSATSLLEDVEPALRSRLTSAQPGDLVGPVAAEGRFTVVAVTQRVAPSVDDRAVRERARERIEQRIVGAEIDRRVKWHERF